MDVKALIIHLERATDRRPQVQQLVDRCPLPTEVIAGVDGAILSDAEANALYRPALHRPRYPFPLRRAEVACFASHRKCWQTIVEQDVDAGLIVEDDVVIDNQSFEPALQLAIDHLEPDSYVRFPMKRRETASDTIAQTDTHRLFLPEVTGVGMQCQLVGKGAAAALLEFTQHFDRPVDTLLQMTWLTGVHPAIVFPSGISERSAELGAVALAVASRGAKSSNVKSSVPSTVTAWRAVHDVGRLEAP